jgi:tol-pal system protein YbgF
MIKVDRFSPLALVGLALALMLGLTAPARAESNSDRLDRIERDMRQLQQDYYSGGQGAAAQPQQSGGGGQSEFMDRLNVLEQSMRELRGQVEESNYRQKQILERLDGVEQKLGVTPATPSGGPVPASPPPGQSGDATPSGKPQTLGSAGLPPPPSASRPGTLGTLSSADETPVADAAPAPAPTDEKGQFDAAIATLYQGNREGGIKALNGFIKQHPKSKQVPSAYYWLGEAQLADKAYRESAQAFLTVVTKYPKDAMAPKSLVKLGSALIAGGQSKEGCKQLKSIKEVFPKADKTVLEMASRERKLANCA